MNTQAVEEPVSEEETRSPRQCASRPLLTVINEGYWRTPWMKCQFGEEEFKPCGFGFTSKKLDQVLAEAPKAAALLRRANRTMLAGYCMNGLGSALATVTFIVVRLRPTPPMRMTAETLYTLLTGLFLAGLFLVGCGFLVDHDGYRCFRKAIDVYNQSITTPSPEKEQ